MADKEQIFIWEVIGSNPDGPAGGVKTHPSYSNCSFAVVAKTMDRVLILAREKYPEIRFHSIQKRNYLGKESVLIDMEVKNG